MGRSNMTKRYYFIKEEIEKEGNNGCKLITSLSQFLEDIRIAKSNGSWKTSNNIYITVLCGICGDEYITRYPTFKRSTKRCQSCAMELRSQNLRLSHDELVSVLEAKRLKFVSGEYKTETSLIKVMCRCGNIVETTYASIRNSSSIYSCPNCVRASLRHAYGSNIEEWVEKFNDIGCELLSTDLDYINAKTRVRFLARCGHVHESTPDSYFNSKYKLCRQCTIEMNSGERTYNWKGGIYDSEREAFRKSYAFKKWIKDVYSRDGYTCQLCDSDSRDINAHHLDGYNWCVDKRTDIDNGITLCEDCHKGFHSEYGYGDNTKEQFEEYKKQLAN